MEILVLLAIVMGFCFMVLGVYAMTCVTPKKNNVIVEYDEGATFLLKAHNGDASYDLCVKEDVTLRNGRQALPTGVRLAMPKGIHCFIMPTSGNSLKGMNARIVNEDGTISEYRVDADVKIGTIDSNYRNKLNVILDVDQYLPKHKKVFIAEGTKVAQIWFAKETDIDFIVGEVDRNTERGENGLGSTDKKA